MICSTCKASNAEAARFCSGCGVELRERNTLPPESPVSGEEITRLQSCRAAPEAMLLDREADPLLGSTIAGKYRIDSKLGAGGMGAVYRATRLVIGDEVAVKILHSEHDDFREGERFRREAQAAARLKHQNAVSIYDFGITDDGLQYLVMELVEGESLRRMIQQEGPLTPSASAEVIKQVCAALDEAHRHNIIHRDIKPDNIMVNVTPAGLRVKVLDFGIAKLRDDIAGNLTQTGNILGTPHYMSPEQCLGEELDHRADIYSFGIVLYEMLTGLVPFNSPTSTAVVIQQVTQPPPPLRSLNASISPAVESVVLHALQKQREARPQTAGAFSSEFVRATEGAMVHSIRSEPRSPSDARWTPTTVMTNPTSSDHLVGLVTAMQAAPPISGGSSRVIVVTALITVLLIGGGGAAALLLLRNSDDDRSSNSEPPTQAGSRSTAQTDFAPVETATSGPPATQPAISPNSILRQDSKSGQQAPVGTWFVILGSYPKTERSKAEQRLDYVKNLGYEAYIVDTNDYSNLRSGLWAVVMGPYHKQHAKEVVATVRPQVHDVYIK